MKKLFTLIAMVAITLMSYAQNQVFWSNGEILFAAGGDEFVGGITL